MSPFKKNILLFNPSFSNNNVYLPYFWASAKTYYEHNGKHIDNYNWVNPLFNFYTDQEEIKKFISDNPPAVFGVSLYVWNYSLAMEIAAWVKETYPNCIVISGGPHQYFKHENNWFNEHPFLDASLAGDEYGELTICDILDNYPNLSWNSIHAVVYPNKKRNLILQSQKSAPKRNFQWNYSVYALQVGSLNNFVETALAYNQNYRLQGMLETTRGCPYSCSFCDWGGGTSTKIVAKDLFYVEQDVENLAKMNIEGVYICDANLGILKDRDVTVMQLIATAKQKYPNMFSLYYGGYAKTSEALPYIEKILEIEAEHQLMRSMTYKLSIQSLDADVLKNIDRVDVSFNEYKKLSNTLHSTYKYNAYAEIIAGLPGITPDKFYEEINQLSNSQIGIAYYDWFLLPETPSYSTDYRLKYQIKTVGKQYNQSNRFKKPIEIVVSTYSYTLKDYQEMHVSYAWYRAFWTAGFLNNSIKIPLGDFTRLFYRNFLTTSKSGIFLQKLMLDIDSDFKDFYNLPNVKLPNLVKLIASTIYTNLDDFRTELSNWLLEEFPSLSNSDVMKDLDSIITLKNFSTKKGWVFKTHYTNIMVDSTSMDNVLDRFADPGILVPPIHFLRAKTSLF